MPDGGETIYQTGTGDYLLARNDGLLRESTGEAALVQKMRKQREWERCIDHTYNSVRGGNADAILVCGASAAEDEAHKEQRRKQVERLREQKRGVEVMSDAEYRDFVSGIAGPEGSMFPVPDTARQDAIDYYDRQISELQNGAEVYTTKDNLIGLAKTPVRVVEGAWGLLKGAGNTVVDLGKGMVAGEMMQSPDAATRAEGERLAKEAGDSLAQRGKSVVEGIFQILPNMAKQASAGNWGEPLGDTAAGLGASKLLGLGRRGAAAARVGEPVSVANGEYLETWRDFLIPGTFGFDGARYMGLKLDLPGRYCSPLGACQISMFDEIFSNPERGKLVFHSDDGKHIGFDRPFNFLPASNAGYPHLELTAPWLKQLALKDGRITKHFRQYGDGFYRLEKIDELNGFELVLTRTIEGHLVRADGPDGLSLAFDNDTQGRRTKITLIGADGSEVELAAYAYDRRGRMTSADCAFGMSVRYQWQDTKDLLDSWHNITRASETRFTYDAEGRVIHTATNGIWNDDCFDYRKGETAYLPGGREAAAQRFQYDENENITTEIDALGGTISHRYNRAGFRVATRDANGHESSVRYDTRGNPQESRDAEGRVTTHIWGDDDELMLVIDGAGNKRKYEHDFQSNVIAETDAEGHVTRLVRDDKGRVVETHFPNGGIERHSWDDHNRLTSVTDAKGNSTSFDYDAFGRLIATTDALGGVMRRVYAAGAGGFDTPTEITRPDGVVVSRAFDAQGLLSVVRNGEGRSWRYQNGAFGVLEQITDPKGGKLSFGYDIEGRVLTVTNALGRVYRFGRDLAGRVVEEEDFDGRIRRYERDAAGQVTAMLKPDGARLIYGYDKSGLVKRIESFAPDGAAEEVTRFWYDARGLLTQAENRAALVKFERDKNGRIISETLNGQRIKSGRDSMGQRVLRDMTGIGGGLAEYVRDPLGQVEKLVVNDTAIAFSRDALGRETERRLARGFGLEQRFDAAGQLIEQQAGGGQASANRVSPLGINVPLGEAAAQSGARRLYEYDRAFAPVRIDDALWGETKIAYDENGQLASSLGASGEERFAYDSARNVAGASSGPYRAGFGGASYRDTPLNNWTSTPGGVVQIARGPKGERIRLTHDHCGRLVERHVERDGFRPKKWRYGWDAFDRLASCIDPDGQEWLYRYDPFGRRVTKVRKFAQSERRRAQLKWPDLVAGDGAPKADPVQSANDNAATHDPGDLPEVGTAYLWDGAHMVAEAPLHLGGRIAWDKAVRWHFEGGEPNDDAASHRLLAKELPAGAKLSDGTVLAEPALYPIVCDHLGTPKEMFDAKGDLVWAVDHHVWGDVRATRTYGNLVAKPAHDRLPDAFACPWRFPGQYEDAETGLYYNRHRHYDPLTAQYASPDPIGLAGGDRPQGYVGNPQVWVDPLGLEAMGPAAQVTRNRLDGTAREVAAGRQLTSQYPDASVFRERYLRTADGKIAKDPLTGEGRRIDYIVVRRGRAVDSVEVTSQTASKDVQTLKEQRIRANGGTFIRDPITRQLIDVGQVPTRVMRLD